MKTVDGGKKAGCTLAKPSPQIIVFDAIVFFTGTVQNRKCT